MPKIKTGLGRGLDSLITTGSGLLTEEAKESAKKAVSMVDIYKVEPDRDQPRKEFDDEKLEELSSSIAKYGVIQPLLVQEKEGKEGKYYQIIAGERRWRAAKKAGLTEVPVIIKDYKSEDIFVVSLIENIQREDLNPMEEAEAYNRLREEYGFTHEKLAESIGKSRSAITNSLRLLNLEPEVRAFVASGEVSFGHAKVLAGIEDGAKQKKYAEKVAADGLSVRALEALIANDAKAPTPKKEVKKDVILEAFAKDLSEHLNAKVKVASNAKGNKGKIEIEYSSADDLVRLSEMLMK